MSIEPDMVPPVRLPGKTNARLSPWNSAGSVANVTLSPSIVPTSSRATKSPWWVPWRRLPAWSGPPGGGVRAAPRGELDVYFPVPAGVARRRRRRHDRLRRVFRGKHLVDGLGDDLLVPVRHHCRVDRNARVSRGIRGGSSAVPAECDAGLAVVQDVRRFTPRDTDRLGVP